MPSPPVALVVQPRLAGSALENHFAGTTKGSATVRVVLSGSHSVRDRTRSRRDGSGALLGLRSA